MKTLLHKFLLIVAFGLVSLPSTSWAQSGPRIDPAFRPQEFYQPAAAVMIQLRSGARLIIGPERVEQRNVAGLARLLPSGQFDAAFSANVNHFWKPQAVVETADEKLLVLLDGLAVLNGREAQTMVRLNADGTHDLSFQAPLLGMTPRTLLPLPDGRVLLAGTAKHAAGTGAAYNSLVRLNADGSLDAAFQPDVRASSAEESIFRLLQQPDGKLLIVGTFSQVDGQERPALARLQADGTLDVSFAPSRPNTFAYAAPYALALQPDGKLLVADYFGYQLGTGTTRYLARLLPDGTLDPGFVVSNDLGVIISYYPGAATITVRADGRIYIAYAQMSLDALLPRRLVRLLPTGAYDPEWQFQHYSEPVGVSHLQLLADGKVLVSGPPALYGGLDKAPTGAALLTTDGMYVPAFAPLLHRPGTVAALALQADGKMLVAGSFTYAQGQPVQGLARLRPTGNLDAEFSSRSRLAGPIFTGGRRVVVQADGKILVTGNFTSAGGLSRWGVARLLPDGSGDASFTSPFSTPTQLSINSSAGFGPLAVQADGKVLVPGTLGRLNGQYQPLWRLTATGQNDSDYVPEAGSFFDVSDVVALPDGKALVAGYGSAASLQRLLPNGRRDITFTATTIEQASGGYLTHLARYPDGRILVGGYFSALQGHVTNVLARLLPDGSVDRTFSVAALGIYRSIGAVAIQPNGRILLSTAVPAAVLMRLLPDGSADTSFPTIPLQENVAVLQVQPDGAILVGGAFDELLNQYQIGVARLLDNNVLSSSSQRVASTPVTVWPVPAHDELHLHLDAAACPLRVDLLDALGRVVLTQSVSTSDFTLRTADFPAGTYLARVNYKLSGAVLRRIVLQ